MADYWKARDSVIGDDIANRLQSLLERKPTGFLGPCLNILREVKPGSVSNSDRPTKSDEILAVFDDEGELKVGDNDGGEGARHASARRTTHERPQRQHVSDTSTQWRSSSAASSSSTTWRC